MKVSSSCVDRIFFSDAGSYRALTIIAANSFCKRVGSGTRYSTVASVQGDLVCGRLYGDYTVHYNSFHQA